MLFNGFGGDVLNVRGGQFLYVHLERAVAIDIDDQLIGMSSLDTHASWRAADPVKVTSNFSRHVSGAS